ncbi:uncharacterized protein MONOS_1433 [Monocercomonoides exilis]|uniref:uncharacterized protein n=1 Tax=Monocercomonoides exilis TaxID=2049356 RepID=UPI00355A9FCB|nr:hypothetical protein MONOS_1433 [Monocercomonoides exilis]|eukprot:MONOS_1433.1-p1 / transcript=MONOS_1433.1 / gene=MONOS_1433 / organism=Monocercomonoides_exilis_PA203 / gene_product=unspecified product / transcript_product=unspecified product / location=Mono_scaffold00025:136446-144158(-) / protein_length=2570 / sequence_SO=supercontig / SO=protein_coding / is_pseudo=false
MRNIAGCFLFILAVVCSGKSFKGDEKSIKSRKAGADGSGSLLQLSIVENKWNLKNSSVDLGGLSVIQTSWSGSSHVDEHSTLSISCSQIGWLSAASSNMIMVMGALNLKNVSLKDNGELSKTKSVAFMGKESASLLVSDSKWRNVGFCGKGSFLRSGEGGFEAIRHCEFDNITQRYFIEEGMKERTMMKASILEDCRIKSSMNVLEGGVVGGTEGSSFFSCSNCTFLQSERVDWKMKNTERNETTQNQSYVNAEWNGCSAPCGGALYVHDNSSATLTVENSSFVKCNATYTRGGGIFALNIGECTVKHSTFDGCFCASSEDCGGAGVEIDVLHIQARIENCFFKDGWSGNDGGGIGMWGVRATKTSDSVLGCFFKNCSGHNSTNGDGGGVLYWTAVDFVVIKNCLFQGCSSDYQGGGISMQVNSFGGNLVWFCFFHNNYAPKGNDIQVYDNFADSQLVWCYSTRTEGVRYYANGDKSEWLPNDGGKRRFVASKESQENAKDTFSCGLNESCACLSISHCLSQMISGFVEEIKVLSGTVVEGKGVDVGEKAISVNGVSSSGSIIETKFEGNGLSLFCVGTGKLCASDLSVVHNSSFENNRQCRLFEMKGNGSMDVKRMNISMDAAHSEERNIQNSLVKIDDGELKMQDVIWGQTFVTTSLISVPQESSVTLTLGNCTFNNIVKTAAGSSLMSVGEGSYSITFEGCTIDDCGSEDSEFGGGMTVEVGSGNSLNVKGGVVKNCYASATQGRGGGIGLKARNANADFLISSAFEGNRAKWGSDIFVDSPNLESTATSGKITSLTASFDTKSKMQGYENGDESFSIPLCIYLWNNFSGSAFVGGGSSSHDFSKCGYEEFPCSTIAKAASVHFEGKKKDVALLEPFAFEDELRLTSNEWSIKGKVGKIKCDVSDQKEGAQRGLIENTITASVIGIVFSMKKSLTFHERVFECCSGKLKLNECGMEGGTEAISTVLVKAIGGAVEVSEFATKNMKIGDSSVFVVEGNAESVPSMNMTKSDFGEMSFGDGCVVECRKGIIEEMSGCTFSSVSRSKGSGGCIRVVNNENDDDGRDYKVEINDCTFEGCAVEEEGTEIGGGALFYEASTYTNLLMKECKFYCCRAPYEGERVGYGGGIMLKILKEEEGKAGFVISSPVFSSDKPNNAKYGKDLFISSPSLASSVKNETLPFVKDRLEMLTEDSMRGHDGGDRKCAIPLIYFWKAIESSVYVAREGNNVVVCGLEEYPCGSVDYGIKRGSNLGIESIAVQGICDVRSEMSVSGMKVEGTNMESDKIQFAQALEGDEEAVVECKGIVQFKEVGILIPSSFDNGASILIQTSSDAIKTSIVCCSIHMSDNVEGEVSFVLISAKKGIVEIEKTKMTGFSTMHEIMSLSADCVITMSDVAFEDISLIGKSAIAMSESVIFKSGNDNSEEIWNIVFEQCTFMNVKHSVSNNPSLLCCDVPNEVRLKMENSTIDECGSTSSNEGGGMFFLLNEKGSLEINHTNVTDCFCSNNGRGGGLFLKSMSVTQKALPFVLSNISFRGNVALKGRDVFVKCTDLDSQISESQFLINFGEPFVKDLAIWGCTSDSYGDEEDLLGRVYVFRSEFIFVSSIVGNSSNSKNCGEMKGACSSLNVGVSHIIPSDYSQLYIWNETELTGSCSAQKVAIKSMEANRNAEIKVREIELEGEGVVTISDSVRIEKVSFVFGGKENVVCSSLILQLNGSVILESVSFLSESRTTENSHPLFDFSLLVVENGIFEAEKCNVDHLKILKPVFMILNSERATFEELTICNAQCTSSVINCGKSEKIRISKLAATNITLQGECSISIGHDPSFSLSLLHSSFEHISRSASDACIVHLSNMRSAFEMFNCSICDCTSDSEKGSQVTISSSNNVLMELCKFEGNTISESEEMNGSAEKICQWNGSVVDFTRSEVSLKESTIKNSSEGGLSVRGGNVVIEKGEFVSNNPSIGKYPSARRNILCSDSAQLNIISLKGGDGVYPNSSMWILNDGCSLMGIVEERASPLFIPTVRWVETEEKEGVLDVVFRGTLLLPCNLSFRVVSSVGDVEQMETHEISESGFVSEEEVRGTIGLEMVRGAEASAEVRVCILFGDGHSPSATESFILKNRSEVESKGDERIVEGGKEGKSIWPIIVVILAVMFLIVFVVSIALAVRWRKVKNEAEDLREIVNDNIRKDPKAFEMVTMEMSPEEQWRRAEKEAEKKNEERIKKRVYGKQMQHSESSEHLLSESGSTEYILGRDSDKIPQWMLEKDEEEEETRKRTPSPSISSTSTTDTDTTFVRSESLCPTTSSMSNLVDAMACSSPHEKLIVDLRDSLFMLLHGRNKTKEMPIGSLKEREQTAAQILFWVANGALHSFDEMENPLQSLSSLSPHIVLFSEHMVICIVMHSDLLSDDDSDSSSISSSTVVTSASDDDDEDDDPLPSSAFEDEDDFKKECLRWKAPELLINKKMGATKESVAFSIGMMLWECLTLQIPFGDYEAEVAGQKIVNGERLELRSIETSQFLRVVKCCVAWKAEDRPSLTELRKEFICFFPSGATMLTITDAIRIEEPSGGSEGYTRNK